MLRKMFRHCCGPVVDEESDPFFTTQAARSICRTADAGASCRAAHSRRHGNRNVSKNVSRSIMVSAARLCGKSNSFSVWNPSRCMYAICRT